MGTWGVGIFSDDFAADIRGEWRDALADGVADAEATATLIARFRADALDPDEAVVFWCALAAAQSETGRLAPTVRDKAVALIDAGGDIERWREASDGLARQRARVLARLRAKLLGSQPKPKRVRRPPLLAVRFEVGDVILVRNPDDATREALYVVVAQIEGDDYKHSPEAVGPVVERLDWESGELPDAEELAALRSASVDLEWEAHAEESNKILMLSVGTPTKADRFGPHIGEVIAHGVPRQPTGPYDGPEMWTRHLVLPGLRMSATWPEIAAAVGTEALEQRARDFFAELVHLEEWRQALIKDPNAERPPRHR
jgi:hypothetical protein